jgi:arylsulfate sulfotransferase
MSQSCRLIYIAIFGLLFQACNKHEPQQPWVHGTDSLAQSIYTVSRGPNVSSAGFILLAPFGSADTPSHLMLLDGDGHLLWERLSTKAIMDFKRWTYKGLVRYSWLEQDAMLYPGSQSGSIVVSDANFNELNRIELLAHGSVTDPKQTGVDGHDFILLDDDHYIVMAYLKQYVHNLPASLGVGNDAYVVSPIIQEVKAGKVVWQWEGAEYPEFYTSSNYGNNYSDQSKAQDYMHINSMFIDTQDGNLIWSARSLDQIVKVSRQTGEIVWRLGGKNSDFALTPEMRFLRQHNATYVDGGKTLLLFDNGDLALRPYSRILEFQLNEQAKTISSYKSFDIPAPLSRIMSSVQKLGRHYFIGGGSGNYVLEIDFETGEKILELKANVPTYRAYKVF